MGTVQQNSCLMKIKQFFQERPGWEMLFIVGLQISYVVANFYVMVLITILTDVWQLKLLQATIITIVQSGSKGIFVVFIACLADSYFGDSVTLLYSAILYCGGLFLLYSTYPSITDQEMKACREKGICNEKTIGNKFYLALVLITIGQCGYINYQKSLQWEEQREKLNRFKKRTLERKSGFNRRVLRRINFRNSMKLSWINIKKNWYVFIGVLISILVVPHVGASKLNQLLIRVCMLGVSSCIFIAGKLCVYPFEGPKFENPIVAVFKVILVAFKNRHFNITTGAYEYYFGTEIGVQNQNKHSDSEIEHGIDGSHIDNQSDYENKVNLTRKLGFLSKAALYESLPGNPQADLEKRRLYTIKEVEEAKIFLSSALLSLTFLTYGIVSSITGTLFVEQANNMDRHVRSFNLPVQLFMLCSTLTESYVFTICGGRMFTKPKKRFNGGMRISLGMLASVFCFIAAYNIEVRRLKVLKHGVTLSAFWFIPQLILTGIMNGLAKNGISNFLANDMPYSIRISYAKLLAEALISGGKLLSIALFLGVNYATKLGDHPSCFGDRINDSRVDKFYLIMMVFAFISFILFVVTVCVVRLLKSSADIPESQDVQEMELEDY